MMTRQQAEHMLHTLSEHYGEPVMPISRYCQALETWGHAVAANHSNEGDELHHIAVVVGPVTLAIRKSNLLARLIYDGQKLRSQPCPVHKGHWSGCVFEDPGCGCVSGGNVTGWLPEPEED